MLELPIERQTASDHHCPVLHRACHTACHAGQGDWVAGSSLPCLQPLILQAGSISSAAAAAQDDHHLARNPQLLGVCCRTFAPSLSALHSWMASPTPRFKQHLPTGFSSTRSSSNRSICSSDSHHSHGFVDYQQHPSCTLFGAATTGHPEHQHDHLHQSKQGSVDDQQHVLLTRHPAALAAAGPGRACCIVQSCSCS